MKKNEMKQMNKEQLERELQDAKGRISKLKFEVTTGEIKSTADILKERKIIARILTFLNQPEEKVHSSGKKAKG